MKHLFVLLFALTVVGVLLPLVDPGPAQAQDRPRDCVADCSSRMSDCILRAERDLATCGRSCSWYNAESCLERCHDRHLEQINTCLGRFNDCLSGCFI